MFSNILDMAGVNASVINAKATGSRMSRRKFLYKLANELIGMVADETDAQQPANQTAQKLGKRVACQVKENCKQNKTIVVCNDCNRAVCGKCQL